MLPGEAHAAGWMGLAPRGAHPSLCCRRLAPVPAAGAPLGSVGLHKELLLQHSSTLQCACVPSHPCVPPHPRVPSHPRVPLHPRVPPHPRSPSDRQPPRTMPQPGAALLSPVFNVPIYYLFPLILQLFFFSQIQTCNLSSWLQPPCPDPLLGVLGGLEQDGVLCPTDTTCCGAPTSPPRQPLSISICVSGQRPGSFRAHLLRAVP